MKSKPTLQTKRKTPKPTSVSILNAVTGNRKKKKQRAATATAEDIGGEVPGVGVARALVVIALLHIVAIGGIWLHNNWSEENALKAPLTEPSQPVPKETVTLIPDGKHYSVQTGDNYFNVARKHGVDMQELKSVNDYVAFRAGMKINIPSRQIEATTPSESVVGKQLPILRTESAPAEIRPVERPIIQAGSSLTIPGSRPGDLVEVQNTPPSRVIEVPEDQPLLIKPRVFRDTPAARAVVVEEPASTMKVHVLESGQTLWALSRKYGVTPGAIMKANGIKDATKIHIGAKLKIPSN